MAQLGRAEETLAPLPAETSADSTSMTREASGGIAPPAVTATPKLCFQQQQQGWELSQWIRGIVRASPSPLSPGPIVGGFPCTAPSVLTPPPPPYCPLCVERHPDAHKSCHLILPTHHRTRLPEDPHILPPAVCGAPPPISIT